MVVAADLPYELVEIVVSLLRDRTILLNCSLVCRQWRAITLPLLFSSLTFDFLWNHSKGHDSRSAIRDVVLRTSSLNRCIDHNPQAAHHVRNLTLRNCRWADSEMDHWQGAFWEVARFLRRLRGVEVLTLRNVYYISLPNGVRRRLGVILESPSLISIDLDNLTVWKPADMVELLGFSPCLRVLRPVNVKSVHPYGWADKRHLEDLQSVFPDPQSICLSELHLDSPKPHFDWIFQPSSCFHVKNLRSVYIANFSLSSQVAAQVLQEKTFATVPWVDWEGVLIRRP